MTHRASHPPRLEPPLHPQLTQWISRKFGQLTPAQAETIPHILRGDSVLLSSPTGTGKTLAAFLGVFDYLFRQHEAGTLAEGFCAIYISPLRALAYDIQKNLQSPLEELGAKFIRVALRTGDSTAREREQIKRRPPHILVTTPESLALMLHQPAYAETFARTRFLIIDELHALAENKRGTHLMLSAEVLEEMQEKNSEIRIPKSKICRIGLSATVYPLPVMAQFLTGADRPCAIVAQPPTKPMVVEVFSPLRHNPYPAAGFTAGRVMAELAEVVQSKKTTLIFTNTRGGAESIGLRLKEALPELATQIEVHHASLDRSIRLEVEDRLKNGELRAVVCSATLELGIDIGSIDLVVMISAPKGVARALQRIGRSGHSIHQSSHGLLVATNINDLVECCVTAKLMERRELEPLRIPANSRDVLAQLIVGLALSVQRTEHDIWQIVRRAYPYRELPRADFETVLHYLQGGGAILEKEYAPTFGKITRSEETLGIPHPRVRRDYLQNIGTIASETMVRVRLGRKFLGQVEEGFIKRLKLGDLFVLNGQVLRLVKTRLLEVEVVAARGQMPTVPRWNANKMPLASGLAREVVRLRQKMAGYFHNGTDDFAQIPVATDWLVEEYQISASNAEAIARQMRAQALVSAIPTGHEMLVEIFCDQELRHYFFHSLIGRSANDALSRIVAWRLREVKPGNAMVTIDDYGFLLTLRLDQELNEQETRQLFALENAETDLHAALQESELVKWQFRGVAQTGLMVARSLFGEQRKPKALQWSTEILFEVLQQNEPDHPLLLEAYHEATHQFLDLARALSFLRELPALPWKFQSVSKVSPLAFGIFVSKIKETMMMEEVETAVERLYHQMYAELEINR